MGNGEIGWQRFNQEVAPFTTTARSGALFRLLRREPGNIAKPPFAMCLAPA